MSHEYLLELATSRGEAFSTCKRARIGTIILSSGYSIVTDHNGAPDGMPSCLDLGCKLENGHCIRSMHSEQRAIIRAGISSIQIQGAFLYTPFKPCYRCSQAIIQSGIHSVFYAEEYPGNKEDILSDAGIHVQRLDIKIDKQKVAPAWFTS